ncbi:glycosyltransferase family 2 protein [Salinimicrobium flavum]|uniref:Glycosyltransferase family 2 protein n=1 Tax=Salinimicrobium flavum TaxID=1737065 RepID=A0ABW5IWT2_9FLAO
MKFNLIICTLKRPKSIKDLLDSVACQTLYPDEILVIDASPDNLTANLLQEFSYTALKYFKVNEKNSGLTRQRNYGISKTSKEIEVICFLDDDIILEPDYFENLIRTYTFCPTAVGVGGYISNEVVWKKSETSPDFDEYKIDGFIRKLGSRNLLRKKIGLLSDQAPGVMPEFSNGLSIGFLPPSGNIYPVEYFMGGVASYRKEIFEKISFSDYFKGYGLYEDMDFCLRASRFGPNYVNTAARVTHHHEEAGRPNRFKYGQMVIRNGWHVWRVKYSKPSFKGKLKWHLTAFLLISVRISNIFTTPKKREAFSESAGRIIGWLRLMFS